MSWYNIAKEYLLDPGQIAQNPPLDLKDDTIRVALMVGSYTFNNDDLTMGTTGVGSFEFGTATHTVTGYTVGGDGRLLASVTVSANNTANRGELDAADLTFSLLGNGSNNTMTQIIIFRAPSASESNGTRQLIAHTTVASTLTNGGDITLQWDSTGILHVT